jgi:hypothetical protein
MKVIKVLTWLGYALTGVWLAGKLPDGAFIPLLLFMALFHLVLWIDDKEKGRLN